MHYGVFWYLVIYDRIMVKAKDGRATWLKTVYPGHPCMKHRHETFEVPETPVTASHSSSSAYSNGTCQQYSS